VLSGLDRGIKTLSAVAFALGAIVLICVTYADNTWFVLNVGVQTTGYYLQHLIQVGFDCEAFQQLNFELQVALHTDTTRPSTHTQARAHPRAARPT
jgi:choline-glycine betaine transporter